MSKIDSCALKAVIGDYQNPLTILENSESLESIVGRTNDRTVRLRRGIRGDIEVEFRAIAEGHSWEYKLVSTSHEKEKEDTA